MIRLLLTVGLLGALQACGGVQHAATTLTWDDYSNAEYGVRLKVPDVNKCRATADNNVAGALCDYGDVRVVVLTYNGAISLPQLRRAASAAVDIPAGVWKWQGETSDNGYRHAEAWTASADGHSIVGLIGQRARSAKSHVVFIYGTDAALERSRAEVAAFVHHVHAI